MVEFYNVGETQLVKEVKSKTETGKSDNVHKEKNFVVPLSSGTQVEAKGTKVQHSGGNPFYEETDFEHFDGLGNSGMTQADSATKRVKGELARLYNDVKRTNPDAVEVLEFPPLPSVPAKGKRALKLEAYLSALDQYRATCEELLEGVKEQTVVDEVRGGNASVINEVRGAAQSLKNTVTEMGAANLAATMGVGEAVLQGLTNIYNKVDTDTKVIISAVNSNGQRVLRAIDKNTNEIKELVMVDGQMTRDQEYWNSIISEIRTSEKIESVHRHINAEGNWIVKKIDQKAEEIKDVFDPFNWVH